ncbi:hypothetical protein [Acetomicrobium sp.]|uniref:GspE/PulE/PilB domain-containing protein n=1 Tax=Acetomicrobium sp. TaxID=1872099 RepID=UPI002870BEF6|nr:hypothetical protein [Acetomicrobium sp.]MDR9769863.1 hypothetical protein [Acetomicrobium sp.]
MQWKVLREEDLQAALREQRESNKLLGEILIKHRLIDEDILFKALSEQSGLPLISVNEINISESADILPVKLCVEYRIFPVSIGTNEKLRLAVTKMISPECLEEIKKYWAGPLEFCLMKESDMLNILTHISNYREVCLNIKLYVHKSKIRMIPFMKTAEKQIVPLVFDNCSGQTIERSCKSIHISEFLIIVALAAVLFIVLPGSANPTYATIPPLTNIRSWKRRKQKSLQSNCWKMTPKTFARMLYAEILRKEGKSKQAKEEITKAILGGLRNGYTYSTRGYLCLELGDSKARTGISKKPLSLTTFLRMLEKTCA